MARSDKRRGRIVVGALIGLALPLGVACNGIIGLSDFDKGQCSGARCADEGGFPDQFIEGGGDVVQPDAGPDAQGSGPVSWARWPMPNYLVDGGPGSKPPQSPPLVASDAGLVTDTTTKLVWRSTLVPGDFKANGVEAECQKLSGGPWRAPKRIELVSLLDYSHPKPFVDTTRFADLSYNVWTTSEVRPFKAGDPNQAYWVVNFDTGVVEARAGNLTAKVLCVLAGSK
jgi:hypothetical protein